MESAAALFENRAPQKNGAGERDQTERRAQKIIPTINKSVLEPDVEDRNVLVDPATPARLPSRSFAEAGAHTRNRREGPPKTPNNANAAGMNCRLLFSVLSRV